MKFLLLHTGWRLALHSGGALRLHETVPPTPPTPTPAGRGGGGYPDGDGKGRAKPQTLDEASRESEARRQRDTKAQLKAILEDDAEVMQIIERLLEAIDKN